MRTRSTEMALLSSTAGGVIRCFRQQIMIRWLSYITFTATRSSARSSLSFTTCALKMILAPEGSASRHHMAAASLSKTLELLRANVSGKILEKSSRSSNIGGARKQRHVRVRSNTARNCAAGCGRPVIASQTQLLPTLQSSPELFGPLF